MAINDNLTWIAGTWGRDHKIYRLAAALTPDRLQSAIIEFYTKCNVQTIEDLNEVQQDKLQTILYLWFDAQCTDRIFGAIDGTVLFPVSAN